MLSAALTAGTVTAQELPSVSDRSWAENGTAETGHGREGNVEGMGPGWRERWLLWGAALCALGRAIAPL